MAKLGWIGGNGSDQGAAGTPPAAAPWATEWSLRTVVAATLVVLAIAAAFLLLFRFYMVAFLFLVAVMLVSRPNRSSAGFRNGASGRKSASSSST